MLEFNPDVTATTAFAPATCANVAVGFDVLGFPLKGVGDRVTLTRTDEPGIRVELYAPDTDIPLDPDKNIASAVIQNFCKQHGLPVHFILILHKGIPIGSGMGGSAASAVAALVALNGFLKIPASLAQLAEVAIEGEGMVSGSKHADNVVPCLYGGMTLTHSMDPLRVVQLPTPNVFCVLVHPQLRVDTADARAALPDSFPLKAYVQQSANLAGFIAALYEDDVALLAASLSDVLIEPARGALVKGFDAVKQAALEAGALGASFSGSGPSMFAFAKNEAEAAVIQQAMQGAFLDEGVQSQAWVCPVSKQGAALCDT
jgi:homoserine kinase